MFLATFAALRLCISSVGKSGFSTLGEPFRRRRPGRQCTMKFTDLHPLGCCQPACSWLCNAVRVIALQQWHSSTGSLHTLSGQQIARQELALPVASRSSRTLSAPPWVLQTLSLSWLSSDDGWWEYFILVRCIGTLPSVWSAASKLNACEDVNKYHICSFTYLLK